jgi:signal transduction histidine kinase
MDPGISPENEGMGWSNIRSRVAYFKGQVDVQSAPGEGTSVYVEWPFG